jgi:hypothetical protein
VPARWQLGPALLALSVAGPPAAEPPGAQAVIARCAAQAGPVGVAALSKACPGVEQALSQLGLTALLPRGWQKTLTAGELADLGALAGRYGGTPVPRPSGAAALRNIAGRLVPPTPPPTWSDRLMARIRHWTGPLLQRLSRWLRSVAPAAGHPRRAKEVLYGVIAFLLAAVALALTLELRGSGLIRRWSRGTQPRGAPLGAGFAEAAAAPFGEPEWARLRASPARILRLLVEALTRAQRLGHDRHLTCRELQAQARLDTEREREDFARVSRLAERELYGPAGVPPLPEETLKGVKSLYARLLAAAARGGAARS